MNYKIIFIITFTPPYKEYENRPRPEYSWEKPDGSWIGVWGYDWGDLLGKVVVSYLQNIDFEVWQVDERADKIYTAELDDRLVHRQFPAKKRKYLNGLKIAAHPYSKSMIEYAEKYNNSSTILFIPSKEIAPLSENLIKAFPLARKVHYNFLNTKLLLPSFVFSYNPIRLFHRFLLNRTNLRNLKGIKNLVTGEDNPLDLKKVKKINPEMSVFSFEFGVDLDFWKEDISKEEARKKLCIPNDQFIIVLSQRLVPEYQIDKFIEVISRVKSKRDFTCFITGHGLREYEEYLKELVNKHQIDDKIKLVGYVSDEELKNYFIACDAFATVPIMFGGSNGAVKAMAIERPIIHVTLGFTYEFLKKHNAGVYLNPSDYEQWIKTIHEVIDGKKIEIVSRNNVVTYFSWEKTAQAVLQIIENAQ
jgi:glycosyltransferase involved in cell wall biosynthesis